MTLLNYWHFVVFFIIVLLFILGAVLSLKQEGQKMKLSMLFSVSLITLFLAIFSIFIVDKYTKKVELYKLENKRLLSLEKIVYTGIVKNEGSHTIGKVTFEIKLVNQGHATGNVKGGNYFKASGFFDFFKEGYNINSRPQSITKEFLVARNLRPGQAESFRVYFDYPPYFRNTSQFAKVYGH